MANVSKKDSIDDKDKAILRILQDDAQVSLRDMEKELKKIGNQLSTTAIRGRLKKLKESNIIKKTITLIDCRQIGYREMVLASLRVNSSQSLDELKNLIEGGRALAWKYLERLAEKNLLKKTYRGKSTIYQLVPSIKVQLQILYMEDVL